MRGVCIESNNSVNLVIGEIYYLFPHGGEAYYVSRFPRQSSHFGAYQKRYFEIVDQNNEIAQENNRMVIECNETVHISNDITLESIKLEHGKVYKARLYKNPKGYNREFGIYYVTSTDGPYYHPDDCYFYKDAELKKCCGRFPMVCFTEFEELTECAAQKAEAEAAELPVDQWEQLQLF